MNTSTFHTGKNHPQGKKTHCPKGHEYNEKNTRTYTVPKTGKTQRVCKECTKIKGRESRLRAYGITAEEWQTLFDEQKGMCAICGVNNVRDVDHSHVTGKVRGLLCNPCNQALGLFNDNKTRLTEAINYLEKYE